MDNTDYWRDEELDEIKKLCAPLVEYLQTNHKRCNLYSAIIILYDGVLLATGSGGCNVYFPFKVPD